MQPQEIWLELIPREKVEIIFNAPPDLAHKDVSVRDGFGDVAFLVKYNHNAILSIRFPF